MHGYEMFQTLTARHEGRIVKVRPGSLYHAVYRLAEEDLIRTTTTGRTGNRPERTTFEITSQGAAALTERLRELVATPVNEFPRFVVALAEIHNLDFRQRRASVHGRIVALEDDLAELRTLIAGQDCSGQSSGRPRLPARVAEAQVAWLRGFVKSMRTGQTAVAHGC